MDEGDYLMVSSTEDDRWHVVYCRHIGDDHYRRRVVSSDLPSKAAATAMKTAMQPMLANGILRELRGAHGESHHQEPDKGGAG